MESFHGKSHRHPKSRVQRVARFPSARHFIPSRGARRASTTPGTGRRRGRAADRVPIDLLVGGPGAGVPVRLARRSPQQGPGGIPGHEHSPRRVEVDRQEPRREPATGGHRAPAAEKAKYRSVPAPHDHASDRLNRFATRPSNGSRPGTPSFLEAIPPKPRRVRHARSALAVPLEEWRQGRAGDFSRERLESCQ